MLILFIFCSCFSLSSSLATKFIVNPFRKKYDQSRSLKINSFENAFLFDLLPAVPVPDIFSSIVDHFPLSSISSLTSLEQDSLLFLCVTIIIVPLFKQLNTSPVIGFLFSGLLLGPAGLNKINNLSNMEILASFGVTFLLFEQGLKLSVDRMRSLWNYVFGFGTLQFLLSTSVFTVFTLVGASHFFKSTIDNDCSIIEAVVIGAALSLSSSAFSLQILEENNQLSSKEGSAALGVLLLQDVAIIPLLVLLPITQGTHGISSISNQASLLGTTFFKISAGLGGILYAGKVLVRFLFSMVAKSNSSEAFLALVLLVAIGVGALTDSLGLSSALGAFVAGTLLAESNYRTQIETDIRPFRGILLGMFFLTTGASVDPSSLLQQWSAVLSILFGFVAVKTMVITAIGPFFGLSRAESLRTGFLLAGGDEFAFVIFTLADKLDVLPDQLAKLLVGVVVMSMALTPSLANFGERLASYVDKFDKIGSYGQKSINEKLQLKGASIVVCGYGNVGQSIVRHITNAKQMIVKQNLNDRAIIAFNMEMIMRETTEESAFITDDSQPTSDQQNLSMITDRINKEDLKEKTLPTVPDYIVFDLDPTLVIQGYKRGANILYGDGSQSMVLETAGVRSPKAFVVTYSDSETAFKSIERIRECFPKVPIIARATTGAEYFHLLEAGATKVFSDETESSLVLGSAVLSQLGLDDDLVLYLRQTLSEEMCTDMESRRLKVDMNRTETLSKRGFGEKLYTGDLELGIFRSIWDS